MAQKLIERQVLYDGKKVRLEVHHLEDEETQKRVRRELVVHRGAVVILPFVGPDRILLLRQRRYTVGQYLVELPAGTLEKNEDPMNCAGRELQEETGHLAQRLKPLMSFFPSPGILSEKIYAFVAYDLQKTRMALEEGEEIEVFEAGFDEAVEMVRDGRIQDAKTVATLLYYDRFHSPQLPPKD